jgi:hypothetical protein
MKYHSATAQAAYHDLRRSLMDDQVASIRGTPMQEARKGRIYWYDTYRVGDQVKKTYIGEDTPEMATRIANHLKLSQDAKQRAEARTRLVRILRAEGFLPVDGASGRLYNALAKTGVFRLGGTVVGTHAFRQYEGELGIRMDQDEVAQTNDLDIAQFERLSLALEDQVEEPLASTFADLDFAPVPSLNGTAVWKWRQTQTDTYVEFLTPSFRPEEDIRNLPALGVAAQSLHFLNYLIAQPIKVAALYRSGVLLQVPRPERYAIHKLIVSDRRRTGADQLKSRKDRAQAALLVEALAEDRPDELREAYQDARERGPQWRAHIDTTLKRMPETAAKLAAL